MVIFPLCRRLKCLSTETIAVSLCHPETVESDDTHRQIMVIRTLLAIQRQSGLMACRDHHGHLHHFCYPETIKSDGMRRPSWSSAPVLLFRDNQIRWHAKTIMVIRFHCFRDYFSLLFHPETIKFDGIQRPLWSFSHVCYPETIKSDGTWREIMVICTPFLSRHMQV